MGRFIYMMVAILMLLGQSVAFSPSISTAWLRSSQLRSTAVSESAPPQVFIGNMPFSVTEDDLKNLVAEKLGGSDKFASLKIAKDRETKKSRGFGYVNFESQKDAEEAVSKLMGLSIEGREVKVDLSVPKEQRPPRTDAPRAPRATIPADQSVFIGNLDFSVTDSEILAMCNDILGEDVVTKVRLAIDRDTGRPRGFGHLDFKSADDAKKAIDLLNGIELAGRDLRVDAAQRKEDRPLSDASAPRTPRTGAPAGRSNFDQKNSVFLGNLAWDVTTELVEDMINDVLGPGLFVQVRLAVERDTGKMRGFGHVDFKDQVAADRAVNELNGMQVMGRQLRADHAQKKDPSGPPRGGESGSFGAW